MASDKILSRVEGAVGHVIFNNPERRNAVSLDMWEAVERAVDGFAADPAVRLVVFSGAGGKAFVSGADISKFEDERASREAVKHYNTTTARAYQKIERLAKPTVAQIDGYCVGGGVALAVCCDLRICGESSKFAVPAAKLGLGYGFAGVNRLVKLVGPSFAKEIFFTARLFTAEEAKAMGLVNRVVPDGEVAAVVEATAASITANAPLTVDSIKFIVGETLKDPGERDLERCAALVEACFDSQDYIEGRRAFMEKRKPAFTGT
jgi:enoyl-CoA hydratase/carnithine racemase